jgi:hypothetical protein
MVDRKDSRNPHRMKRLSAMAATVVRALSLLVSQTGGGVYMDGWMDGWRVVLLTHIQEEVDFLLSRACTQQKREKGNDNVVKD